jgi:hypothetical protein
MAWLDLDRVTMRQRTLRARGSAFRYSRNDASRSAPSSSPQHLGPPLVIEQSIHIVVLARSAGR